MKTFNALSSVLMSLACTIFLYGCNPPQIKPSSSKTVKMYKFDGSVSCDMSSGISPETMQEELKTNKISVISSSCGTDGLVRAAVCGIETGYINVFEISTSAYTKAKALGYQELSQLHDYREVPCRF